jgi:hypothetical protein
MGFFAKGMECSWATQHYPETDIVVAVAGLIVVAVGGAAVAWIVVPRTATKDTALRPPSQKGLKVCSQRMPSVSTRSSS